MTSLSLVVLANWPRKYESEARLFLRLGRESISLDPSATIGATIQVQESRENQLNSAREMLKSRALLEQVVETIGAERILDRPVETVRSDSVDASSSWDRTVATFNSQIRSILSLPKVSSTEKAIETVSKSIRASLAKNSSVMTVHCVAKNSKLAQEIMQSFLKAYEEQHLFVNRTAGSLEFFESQAVVCKQKLDIAAGELRDAKNEYHLISVSAEQQAIQSQLTQFEATLMAAKASLASTEASTASLQSSLDRIPENLTTQQTTGFANMAADQMHQEYFKLQISINELQAKLGENHPLVKIVRDNSRELQTILDKQATDRTQTTVGVNSTRQSLELDLRRDQALAASTLARVTVLSSQYGDFQQRLETTNQREVRVNDLERQVVIAESRYRSSVDHLYQARIGDALDASRVSNLNIVQPPSLVEKPVSPKPLVIFGLTFVAIFAGSVVLVLGAEFLERTRTRTDDGPIRTRHDAAEARTLTPGIESPLATRCNQAQLNA